MEIALRAGPMSGLYRSLAARAKNPRSGGAASGLKGGYTGGVSEMGDALWEAHQALLELRGPKGSPGFGSFFWAENGRGYRALRKLEWGLDDLSDPRGEQARQLWEPAPKR